MNDAQEAQEGGGLLRTARDTDATLPEGTGHPLLTALPAPAPASARRRSRGRMTDDEKAEKHRVIVRRAYHQKKQRKAALHAEIARLEAQFQSLTALLQLPDHTADHCATCISLRRLQTEYRTLSITKEALLSQQVTLDQQLLQYQVYSDKVGQLLRQTLPLDHHHHHRLQSDPQAITVETTEFTVCFKPLSEEDCFAVIRTALRDIKSQTTATDFHPVGGKPVMAWTRKRTASNFSLLKRFAQQPARPLWLTTWRLYTESRLFEQLYSGTVDMKFHVLQRVNDSNVLFCRTLKTEALAVRNVTFFLLSRFHVESRYYLLFRSVDSDRVHVPAHPEDARLAMFSWLCFTDLGDDCSLEFGGQFPSASVADPDFWMMEFLSFVLRLENRAIGPVFAVLL